MKTIISKSIAAFVVALGFCAPQGALAQDHATRAIDPARFYKGVWLEVARRPMWITEGCVVGTTAYAKGNGPNEVRVRDAFRKGGAGDFLDAFHHLDQRTAELLLDRREADAAVAGDGRGDAMREAGIDRIVPNELSVIMGVQVDKAGRYECALCIDLLGGSARNLADLDDRAVPDRDVGGVAGIAGAVGDLAAPDDRIEHVSLSQVILASVLTK